MYLCGINENLRKARGKILPPKTSYYMENRKRKKLMAICILLGVFVVLLLTANLTTSYLIKQKVDKELALLPAEFGEVGCGSIYVRLFSGTAEVNDIRYIYHHSKKVHKKDSVAPGIRVSIGKIAVGRIFYSLLMNKQLVVSSVSIVRPEVDLWLDDKNPLHSFPAIPKSEETTQKASFPFHLAQLNAFHLEKASVRYHSLRNPLDAKVDSCSLSVYHLSYDTAFHYCDSLYHFALEHAAMTTPDGLMYIETRNIEQKDAGPLKIGRTHIMNTISHKEMAERANEPITWMDMYMASAKIEAFNPVRKILAQDWTFGEISAVVNKMNVVRDLTHKPLKPYRMLQEDMMDIPVLFRVAKISGEIKKLTITLALTPTRCGKMSMQKIHASISNLTNARGAMMKVSGGMPLGDGNASVGINLTMNDNSDFTMRMTAQNADMSFINEFIQPVAGMKLNCAVDRLDLENIGNKDKTTGTFCLQYHDLEVLENNFAGFANAILPGRNPSNDKSEPRAYKTEWKRTPKQEFAFYIFGPMIDGVIKTLLPGVNVHQQIRYKPVE